MLRDLYGLRARGRLDWEAAGTERWFNLMRRGDHASIVTTLSAGSLKAKDFGSTGEATVGTPGVAITGWCLHVDKIGMVLLGLCYQCLVSRKFRLKSTETYSRVTKTTMFHFSVLYSNIYTRQPHPLTQWFLIWGASVVSRGARDREK